METLKHEFCHRYIWGGGGCTLFFMMLLLQQLDKLNKTFYRRGCWGHGEGGGGGGGGRGEGSGRNIVDSTEV